MSATWYCYLCSEDHLGSCPIGPDDPRRLRESLDTQMGRVAQLRGYAGQLRSALRDAYDNAPNGTVVHSILGNALAIEAPTEEAA